MERNIEFLKTLKQSSEPTGSALAVYILVSDINMLWLNHVQCTDWQWFELRRSLPVGKGKPPSQSCETLSRFRILQPKRPSNVHLEHFWKMLEVKLDKFIDGFLPASYDDPEQDPSNIFACHCAVTGTDKHAWPRTGKQLSVAFVRYPLCLML